MTIDRDYQIADLNSNSSFYDWFMKENTEIIEKLNLINTFSISAGDGITAPIATSGTATVALSGTVNNSISFNGAAYFNNFVSIPNIAIKVPQINSTVSGFTFGTPVRIYQDIDTGTIKYEPCRANDPDQAEVLGVVSAITTSFAYVTLIGKIDGDFSVVNKRGIGLTAGWIYFLDPGITGSITDVEPTTVGQISKPVLMGLSADSAMVMQLRGNYLNANDLAGPSGPDIAPDVIAINVGVNSGILTPGTFNPGTAVVVDSTFNAFEILGIGSIYQQNIISYFTFSEEPDRFMMTAMTSRDIPWSFGTNSGTYVVRPEKILGVIKDIIPYEDALGTGHIVEILTNGYTQLFDTFVAGAWYLNPAYPGAGGIPQYTQTPSDTLVFIKYDKPSGAVVSIRSAGGVQGTRSAAFSSGILQSDGTNYLVNGNFEVWQRDNIGRDTAYTQTGNIVFADMWRRHDGITSDSSTKSYSILRQTFDEYQDEIEGNPSYYLDIKALGLSAIGASGTSGGYADYSHLMVGHVVPGAKKFDLTDLHVKFYGKCTSDNYPIDVYFSRYSGTTLLNYIKLGSTSLTTSWQEVSFNRTIPALENNGVDIDLVNDYCEIGIDLIPTIELANINGLTLGQNLTVSVASFAASIGSNIPSSVYLDYPEQLKYCQQFYYTNYEKVQKIADITMYDPSTPTHNVHSVYIQPNKSCSLLKWPIEMRTVPTVSFYSPFSGIPNEAFNQTAGLDLRNTSGTVGYNSAVRTAAIGSTTINGVPSIHGVNICILNGAVNYDNVYYNIIADADFSI